MKSCVIRRRFHTSEAVGTAVTVNLEPGFGVPKACLIHYVETSAATGSFDTTLAYRNIGISMIGSTDSTRNSTLVFRTAYATMRDNQGSSDVRRQNSNSRFGFANTTARIGTTVGATASVRIMLASSRAIHFSASTTKNKTLRSFTGQDRNGAGQMWLTSGLWMSTSAINRVDLFVSGVLWTTDSTFALYGIKG
jgi:hypothetical protein